MSTPDDPSWLTDAGLRTWRRLMAVMARLPAALEVELQRDAQLSFLEYYTLAALSEAPDRRKRLSELANLTSAELSRMSHLFNRLERRGLPFREPDPTNRRYTLCVITETGMATRVEAAPKHAAEVRTMLFDLLDSRDLTLLDSILERVIARIDG